MTTSFQSYKSNYILSRFLPFSWSILVGSSGPAVMHFIMKTHNTMIIADTGAISTGTEPEKRLTETVVITLAGFFYVQIFLGFPVYDIRQRILYRILWHLFLHPSSL